MAVVVVDRLEVVEVGQHDADRLVGERGLLGDLGEARLQGAAVEQARELVERAVGAMAHVGGDERADVDRGADDERQRDHERLGMVGDVGGIDAERGRQHEHRAHRRPDHEPAVAEARGHHEHRDGEQVRRQAARAAADHSAEGEDELKDDDRRGEDPQLGPAPAIEPHAADRHRDDRQRRGDEHGPAAGGGDDRGRRRQGRERHDARGPQALLHVEEALAVVRGRAQP